MTRQTRLFKEITMTQAGEERVSAIRTDAVDTWEKLHGRTPAGQTDGWNVFLAMTAMIGVGLIFWINAPRQSPPATPAPAASQMGRILPDGQIEFSEAEKRAAFEKYQAQLHENQQKSLDDSLWRSRARPEVETTIQFVGGKLATITHRFRPTSQVDHQSLYRASYERAGERYRFQFDDGSILNAKFTLLGPDTLLITDFVFDGQGDSAHAASVMKFAFKRQP
jgi:hypothetical protein